GGVADGERHVEDLGERAGEQCLAAAGRPDQKDVRLIDFDFAARPRLAEREPLVVVVGGDGEDLFGAGLPDHILIESVFDLAGSGDVRDERFGSAAAALFLVYDALTQLDAFAADVDVARSFDERADVAVALATERTVGVAVTDRSARGAASGPGVSVFRSHRVSCTPSNSMYESKLGRVNYALGPSVLGVVGGGWAVGGSLV